MTSRVEVRPELLAWAVERSGRDPFELWTKQMSEADYQAWLTGERRPTVRQLQNFASKTYTPYGFLLLAEPPAESLPVTDFRRPPGEAIRPISANLRQTVYDCQDRQDWYRGHRLLNGGERHRFVGSVELADRPEVVGEMIADKLGWSSQVRSGVNGWSRALAKLRDLSEELGILVVVSGMVGANTTRKLDPEEFKGFALADEYAPLVSINGVDFESAKIFTLVHELVHLWLGETGLSSLDPSSLENVAIERWCNRVAAEMLVPTAEFADCFDPSREILGQLDELARHFRVSTQVILGRIREVGHIGWDTYQSLVELELRKISELPKKASGGGNFNNSKPVQLSKRFASELIASTLEGRPPYTDAFRLLGIAKQSTFDGLAAELGVT